MSQYLNSRGKAENSEWLLSVQYGFIYYTFSVLECMISVLFTNKDMCNAD